MLMTLIKKRADPKYHSIGFTGKKHSDETKQKIRAAKLANPTKYWHGKQRANRGTGIEYDYSTGSKKNKYGYFANYARRVKNEVFGHYCNGNIACVCCGEAEIGFLSIDHIYGGGNRHRRELKGKRGVNFYRWLKQNGYPSGFQVLCFNCNFAKGHSLERVCPHITYTLPKK